MILLCVIIYTFDIISYVHDSYTVVEDIHQLAK